MPRDCDDGRADLLYRLLDDSAVFTVDLTPMRLFVSGLGPVAGRPMCSSRIAPANRILERYGWTENELNTSTPMQGIGRRGTVGLAICRGSRLFGTDPPVQVRCWRRARLA